MFARLHDLIVTVPDHAPGEVSRESLNALRALAEDVISRIEDLSR